MRDVLGQSGHAQRLLRRLRQTHQDLVLVHGDAAAGFELPVEAGGDRGRSRQEGAPSIHLDLIEPTETPLRRLLGGVVLSAGLGKHLPTGTGRLLAALGPAGSLSRLLAVGGFDGFLIALSPLHLDVLSIGRRLHHCPLCSNHLIDSSQHRPVQAANPQALTCCLPLAFIQVQVRSFFITLGQSVSMSIQPPRRSDNLSRTINVSDFRLI